MIKSVLVIFREILELRHQVMLLILMAVNIFVAAFEAFSLYLFVPVLDYMNNPAGFDVEKSLFFPLTDFVLWFGHDGVGLMSIVLATFFLKMVILTGTSLWKNTIIADIRRDISIRIFASSIHQQYEDFVNTRASKIMNNSTAGISHLSNGIIFSSVNILIEVFMIASILIMLIWNTSILTLIVPLGVGLVGMTMIALLRRWAARIGQIRQAGESGRMRVLKETYSSLLEVKTYRSESFFKRLLRSEESKIRVASIGVQTMSEVPKYTLEFLGVLAIFGFFIFSIWQNAADEMLQLNGLYAIAIIKLIPSLNRIVIFFNSMKMALPAFEDMMEVFMKSSAVPGQHRAASSPGEALSSIEIRKLNFAYRTKGERLFSDLNIRFDAGKITGILGQSGAGKTTLINIITGVLDIQDGQFLLNGKETGEYRSLIADHLGYVAQSTTIFNSSVMENVAFDQPLESIDRQRVEAAIKSAEAWDFVQRLPQGVETVLSDDGQDISGGQRQRIALARAIYRNSSVIILDEATNALDQETEARFLETLVKLAESRIVIIVSHSKDVMKVCDKIITLKGPKA